VTTECFVVTDVHTMAEEDQAAAAYLESYDGPGIPVPLDPPADDGHVLKAAQVKIKSWRTFESRPNALMPSKHSSRLSNVSNQDQ
jgi:hypothetical protein